MLQLEEMEVKCLFCGNEVNIKWDVTRLQCNQTVARACVLCPSCAGQGPVASVPFIGGESVQQDALREAVRLASVGYAYGIKSGTLG